MPKVIPITIAAIFGALAAVPAFADPCGAVLCLSTNKTAPHECKGHVDGYFSIRVYTGGKHSHYDPGATSAKRFREVMDKCDGARQQDKDYVQATYGMLERSPFDYVNTDSKGNSTGYSEDSLMKVTETRYLTCADAAGNPKYTGQVKAPTYAALQVPDGSLQYDNATGQVIAQASGGYANHYLGTDNSNGWGGTPIYGFAVETRTITKTTGQGVVTNTTDWAATQTYSCTISDPYSFTQQNNYSGS